MTAVSTRLNRIEVGIDCEANRDSVNQRLPSLLSGSHIPIEAIKVTVYQRGILGGGPDEFECAPPEVIDPVTGQSSPGFGGLFIDFDSDTINVYMLEPSQEKAEELALEIIGEDALKEYPDVRALHGQYTWEQLLEWYDEWCDSIGTLPGSLPDGVVLADSPYPESSMNRLSVRINQDWNPETEATIEDWLKHLGIPRAAVVLLDRLE
ncbi:MAG: hypothetical protein OXC95_04010 [Dehalococcoidia bacterium]|nr:hypothetical protein [Dehalococcoidia bacterium]